MKRLHFEDWFLEGDRIVLRGKTAHRLRDVLRVAAGETVLGADGAGTEYRVTVEEVRPGRVVGTVTGTRREGGESPLTITLAQVVPRHSLMDLVVQKATELGVSRIVPLTSRHSVTRPDRREGLRLARWRKIAAEAVAQSRRRTAPEILPPTPLAEYLGTVRAPLRIVLHTGAEAVAFSSLEEVRPRAVEVIVGPEGGLAPAEVRQCRVAGFWPVRLGPRILRAETAGLAALVLLQHRWGDLDGGSGGDCPSATGVVE